MRRSDHRDLDLLQRLAPTVPTDENAQLSAKAALDRRIASAGQRSASIGRRRWPRLLVLAPVAAAIVIAVSLSGSSTNGPGSAAAALNDAALHIAKQPTPVLGQGQAWYVHQRGAYIEFQSLPGVDAGIFSWWDDQHHKQWISCSGSRHFITTDQPTRFLSAADHARWITAGKPALNNRLNLRDRLTKPFYFLGGYASCAEVRAMPTDPAAIRKIIEQNTVGSDLEPAYEQLDAIAQTLTNAPLSAKQAAALYRTAALIPGIELLGPAHDHAGRPGLVVAADDQSHSIRLELIIDQRTGRLLGKSDLVLKDFPDQEEHAGEEVGWTVYLADRVAAYR